MAIQTNCPACGAHFNLADQMAGKKIRCGKCQEVFLVEKAPVKRREEVLEVLEEFTESPKSKSRAVSPSSATRKAIRPREDEDDRPARRREEEEEPRARRRDQPVVVKSGNPIPWLVGGGVACVAMLTIGVIVIVSMLRSKPDDRQAGTNTPVVQPPVVQPPVVQPPIVPPIAPPENPPPPDRTPVRPREDDRPPAPRRGGNGELSREAMAQVKRATVYLRVLMPDGGVASGTGFFGAADAPNIILTNAHVVGMLAHDSRHPRSVEVFIHSGEKDEKKTTARILGVDRHSDLAVLDIGTTEGAPKPLRVTSADGLHELDKVYVFGFPLGERLGKEITIRPSSVSSLRKRNGVLDRVQVNGGMDPGNSGGPVVDGDGNVVGVAVSGIPGRMINFAIPGERVHTILKGRLSAMGIGPAFRSAETGERFGIPVTFEMLDPLHRVQEVALEVWTGDPAGSGRPANRPPSAVAPKQEEGDGTRQRVVLRYTGGVGKGDVLMPPLPPGKVYWMQPTWTYKDGSRYWAAGNFWHRTSAPLDRKAVLLRHNYAASGPGRNVMMNIENRLRVGSDEEAEVASMLNNLVLNERTTMGGAGGVTVSLNYQNARRTITIDKKPLESRLLSSIRPALPQLTAVLELDANANVRANTVRLRQPALAGQPIGKQLLEFHEPIRYNLEAMYIPLPGRNVNALESWKVTRPMAVETPDGIRRVQLDLICTYLGVLGSGSREVAIVDIAGVVRDAQLSGRVNGQIRATVSTGLVNRVDLDVQLDIPAVGIDLDGKIEKLRVLSMMKMNLDRGS